VGALLIALVVAGGAVSQDAPLWGGLEPGPYAVGFRSEWSLDETRRYVVQLPQGGRYDGPRPILVNLWFPAETVDESEWRSHAAYLDVRREEHGLGAFSAALSAHARSIVLQEVAGKEEAALTEDEARAIAEFLGRPTAAFDAATPASGPFPVVVYHSGAGSSFDDDAVLCELLASHGYVVLGSAFQLEDGSSLGVDGGAGSGRDLEFLLRRARSLPFADPERAALIGHSLGAQAILRHAARPGCTASVLVLLDTTQDYYALGTPLFASLVAEVRGGREHVRQRMLVAAGPEASFQLVDLLAHAERAYLTLPSLDHNDFIAQGNQRRAWLVERGAEEQDAARVRAEYEDLCRYVLATLDAHLGGKPARLAELDAAYARGRLGRDVRLERVAAGVTAPPRYAVPSDEPPSPRQLPHLLRGEGARRTCEVLARFADRRPPIEVLESTMLTGSTLFELVEAGEVEEARILYGFLETAQSGVLYGLTFQADMARLTGKPEVERRILEAAALLDPDDTELQARRKSLEGR